ncbi:MAG TPA: hypothetical protein VFY39_09800, partial [Gammaproteobacteria bacterium]|nr:hypothetical protein [Gammaproteobacteria bacterium]
MMTSPWFILLTVVVLSGGLGISLYTFAALDTMIYRDLPLPDGGSIVRFGTGAFPSFEPLDAVELAEIRAQAKSLSELGRFRFNTQAFLARRGSSYPESALRAEIHSSMPHDLSRRLQSIGTFARGARDGDGPHGAR